MKKYENKKLIQIPIDIFIRCHSNRLLLPIYVKLKSGRFVSDAYVSSIYDMMTSCGFPVNYDMESDAYVAYTLRAFDILVEKKDIERITYKPECDIYDEFSAIINTTYVKYKSRPYIITYAEDYEKIFSYCVLNKLNITWEMCLVYTYILKSIFNTASTTDFDNEDALMAHIKDNPDYRVLTAQSIANGLMFTSAKDTVPAVIDHLCAIEAIHYHKVSDKKYLFVNDSKYWKMELESAIAKEQEHATKYMSKQEGELVKQ